jgi:hypothetical protein
VLGFDVVMGFDFDSASNAPLLKEPRLDLKTRSQVSAAAPPPAPGIFHEDDVPLLFSGMTNQFLYAVGAMLLRDLAFKPIQYRVMHRKQRLCWCKIGED